MHVHEAIQARRAYRALVSATIDEKLIQELATAAQLAPSCFNKQPWRFIFVDELRQLQAVYSTLMPGNEWAQQAAMVIAVFSRKDWDCQLKKRRYYLFDTGLAVSQMMLRATELGWVIHPIAGYDEDQAKSVLNIPEDACLITLLVMGKRSDSIPESFSEQQRMSEEKRPERLALNQFVYRNHFSE